MSEKCINWLRDGRIVENNILKVSNSFVRYFIHNILQIFPAGIHKFLTDFEYLKERLDYLFIRPIRLYFNEEEREKWLYDIVHEGIDKHIINEEDSKTILSQVKDPYIQKYLKSLAVHVCTLPVTQIVSVLIAFIFVILHPEMPKEQSMSIGLGIIAIFQIIPISPGSLVRGSYVLYLAIKEKNFKDYNIALFLSFFKYIGYLAFPIQMVYHYPAMARFMAGHWATEAVHLVPVFGERGALLEITIFNLFYNKPLTLRSKMKEFSKIRENLPSRYWHIILILIVSLSIFSCIDYFYASKYNILPSIKNIYFLMFIIPFLMGSLITYGAKGLSFYKRIISGLVSGILLGIFYTLVSKYFEGLFSIELDNNFIILSWRMFIFSIFSTIGVILTEINLPFPENS